MQTVFLLSGAVLVALAAWRCERRRIQRETRQTVIASVMDSQNNFLNAMVYFRTRAGSGDAMDSHELSQIDAAIREAHDRLIEIAETDDMATRDLGGIHVLARPKTGPVTPA